jgi:hypothetical protein
MGTVAMTGHHLVSPGLGPQGPRLKQFRMILRIILKKEKRKKLQAASFKLDSD